MTANRRGWLRHLPNAITSLRLAAIPVIVLLLARSEGGVSKAAGWTFAGVAVTDFIDGRLARKLQAESAFGRVADPLCDRLLVATGLGGLLWLDRFPAWGPITILARDLAAMAIFVFFSRRGYDPRVDLPGKISSALVMTAVPISMGYGERWVDVLFYVALAGSVGSLLNYGRSIPAGRPLQASDGAVGPGID